MVIAAAGRRIDAPDAPEIRFPMEEVARVSAELGAALARLNAAVLVSSAACGTDILALEVAGRMGMR
jgi:hypothetical protein